MGLDIRLPLGCLFCIHGLLLILAGVNAQAQSVSNALHVNINGWWGLLMLLVGMGLLELSRRGARDAATSIAAKQASTPRDVSDE